MNLIISIHVHVGLLLTFQVVGYNYVISRRRIVQLGSSSGST